MTRDDEGSNVFSGEHRLWIKRSPFAGRNWPRKRFDAGVCTKIGFICLEHKPLRSHVSRYTSRGSHLVIMQASVWP